MTQLRSQPLQPKRPQLAVQARLDGPALNPDLGRLLSLCNMDRRWKRAEGTWLTDDQGRRFLDCFSQYGALALGHNPPSIVSALRQAMDESRPTMVQPYRAPHAAALAERLVELLPGLDHCLFTSSGAETVEAAIKLVRVRTGRPLILACRSSYHGKTMGAMGLGWRPGMKPLFGDRPAAFATVDYGDADAVEGVLAERKGEVAALFVEPIQGEGGVILPPEGYLLRLRELCDRFGVILVLDEIQTGLGRTGSFLACQQEGVIPDVLLLSKAIGGGLFPLGVCLASADVWDERFALTHSSTFANNNLACLAGLTALETLADEDFLADVRRKGDHLQRRLRELATRHADSVVEVRGRGLLAAVELRSLPPDGGLLTSYLHYQGLTSYLVASRLAEEHGILVLPPLDNKSVLRLIPPLIIDEAGIDLLLDGLDSVLGELGGAPLQLALSTLGGETNGNGETSSPIHFVPARHGSPRHPSFAFLMHYTSLEDIVVNDPDLAAASEHDLRGFARFTSHLPPGVVHRARPLTSRAGATAEGWLIALGMLPEDMALHGRARVAYEVRRAVELAHGLGVRYVGLGAFTTGYSRQGLSVTGCGSYVTTGNSLTAVMAFRALERAAMRRGLCLSEAKVGIVGARGSVGSLCAKLVARSRPRAIRLIGNPDSGLAHLNRTRKQLQKLTRSSIETSVELKDLADCQVVLSATTSPEYVLDGADLSPGTVVCDVSRPRDASPELCARTDLDVIEGGLVALPDPTYRLGRGNVQGLPEGIQLACLGETMLLTLAGCEGDFSIGPSPSLEDLDRVVELADEHGFELAPDSSHWGDLPASPPAGYAGGAEDAGTMTGGENGSSYNHPTIRL